MNALFTFLFTFTPLRFYVQSFWRDEAFSYLLAKQSILQLLLTTARDANPPLYYLLLHFWMLVFGHSEFAIRTLSFIFFLGTIYLMGQFLMNFLKISAKWTLAYIAFFAINPLLHYYAFEGRMYSMFAFFSVLSFYFLYKKDYRGYAIASILGLYTHYFMAFVIIAQAVFILFEKKYRTKHLLKMFTAMILSFLPWLAIVILSRPPVGGGFWVPKPTAETVLNLPGNIFTGYENLLGYTYRFIPLISAFFYLFSLAAGYQLLKSKRRLSLKHISQDPLLMMLLLWVIVPLMMIIGISFVKPVYLPRYTIFITIGFLLLFVRLLQPFDPKIKSVLLVIAMLFSLHYALYQATFRLKGDVRKTLTEIKMVMGKNDLVYVTDPYDFHPAEYYINDQVVYIYGHKYENLPWFIGKVLIPKDKIATTLPNYPRKAFIVTGDSSYVVQALY